MLFDCLMDAKCDSLGDAPLSARRRALQSVFKRFRGEAHLRLSPGANDLTTAKAWLARTGVALDGPYQSGERAMLKIKHLRTADCVVGGFRYARDSDHAGSLLLGRYDEDGLLDHVGFTSAIFDAERPGMTKRLERLAGGPGFTGDAPGTQPLEQRPLRGLYAAGGRARRRGPRRPGHRRQVPAWNDAAALAA